MVISIITVFLLTITNNLKNMLMKRYLNLAIITLCLVGCQSSRVAQESRTKRNDVLLTLMVKQIDCAINQDIIQVKYNNNTTLYYKILDNFGNVALTWDENGRTTYDQGKSAYKGHIDIPSFVSCGENDEFIFQVVEIAENAFWGCDKVTKISIPYSVTRIRRNAFANCTGLNEFVVHNENTTYMSEDGVLFSKDRKLLVLYPANKTENIFTLPKLTRFIAPDAFMNCANLTSVTIGNEVTALSDNSFMNCVNLKTLRLGSSVRIIGKESFKNCPSLAEIYSPNLFPPHNCPVVFDSSIKETCKVYVPVGQANNYKKRLEWSEFKNIVEQ